MAAYIAAEINGISCKNFLLVSIIKKCLQSLKDLAKQTINYVRNTIALRISILIRIRFPFFYCLLQFFVRLCVFSKALALHSSVYRLPRGFCAIKSPLRMAMNSAAHLYYDIFSEIFYKLWHMSRMQAA